MQLSKRLLALAQMVSEGSVLADVGCDHGYIPIYLIRNKRIPKAIAMDIGEGPLARARENIRAYGLEGYIETRLSDGLAKLSPGEAGSVIISGMGGPLMEHILHVGRETAISLQELILQPQSDIGHFRKYLAESGYVIVEENMIYEDGKFYPMMKVVRGEASYSELEYRYGPILLKDRHPVLRQYLDREIDKLQNISNALQANDSISARERNIEIREELQLVQAAWNVYAGK